MNPIVRYYLHQAGRGYGSTDIDRIYSVHTLFSEGMA